RGGTRKRERRGTGSACVVHLLRVCLRVLLCASSRCLLAVACGVVRFLSTPVRAASAPLCPRRLALPRCAVSPALHCLLTSCTQVCWLRGQTLLLAAGSRQRQAGSDGRPGTEKSRRTRTG